MATNIIFEPGYQLAVACTNPASPVSGDPVRYGKLTGLALVDEGDGGNESTDTSVNFGPFVAEVTVDDNEGGGIAVGDALYYHDTGTGTGSVHINNSAAGADAFWGIALEAVSANATTAINTMHVQVGLTTTLSTGALDAGLAGTSDGLGLMRVAKATFDPSANSGQRTVAPHGLGVTIPDNALVVGGFIENLTTFADGASDNATIAISVEGANDIVSAIAISNGANPWDAGKLAIIPKANTPESTSVKLSAAREITATVAVHALTAGKATIFLYYLQGD